MAIDLTNLAYPFDPTGERVTNKITGEQQLLRGSDYRDFYFIIPNLAPYFADSLVVMFKSNTNEVRKLIEGIDYYHTHWFMSASLACAKPIFGSITILNRALQGVATLTYQTIGGDWVLDTSRIAGILADRLNNPRSTSWDRVSQMPYNFPVIDHDWNYDDMVGQKELVAGIKGIEDALLATGAGGITEHIANTNNPHQTTAAQVGLGAVRNLGTATTLIAETATADNYYMTPKSTLSLVSIKAIVPMNTHINDTTNPHDVTAAQVGAYTKVEVDQKLAAKVSTTGSAYDALRFGGKLPAEFTAAVLTGTASNASKFGGQTPTEFKAEITGGTVDNANKLGGRTLAQILSDQSIYNALRFGGDTPAEFKADIALMTVDNANKLGGKTAAQILTDGTAGNSTKFGGQTVAQFKADLINSGGGTASDSLRFGGQLPSEYTASVLLGTAANSTKLGGKTAAEILAAGTANNSNMLGGRTLLQLKEDVRLQTSSDSDKLGGLTGAQWMAGNSGSTTLFGGMTAAAFTTSITSATVANATKLNNQTPAQLTASILTGTAANATKFNNLTQAQLTAAVLAGTAADSTKLAGLTLTDLDVRYLDKFGEISEISSQITTPGATGVGVNPVWVKLGTIKVPADGSNKAVGGDAHWLVAGGEAVTAGVKSPLHHLRLSVNAAGVCTASIDNLSDSSVVAEFGYSFVGAGVGRITSIWQKCTDNRTDITVTQIKAGNGTINFFPEVNPVVPGGYVALAVVPVFASNASVTTLRNDVEAALLAISEAYTTLTASLS